MCIQLLLNSIERINKVIIMKYFKLFILAKENKEMIFFNYLWSVSFEVTSGNEIITENDILGFILVARHL